MRHNLEGLLIRPKNHQLIDDIINIRNLFPAQNCSGTFQARVGRYVFNFSSLIWFEGLFLDFEENIIDGFVLTPIVELPWKGKTFTEHLKELNNITYLEGYDNYYTEDEIYRRQEAFSNEMELIEWSN